MKYIGKCDCCGKFSLKLQPVTKDGKTYYMRPECIKAMHEVEKMLKGVRR